MLRTTSGQRENVIEKMGPQTVVEIGEEVSVKYPNWLFIPGTVVANDKGNDDVAVRFDTAVPEVKYYARNSNTLFQRHWGGQFERVNLATEFTAGERVRVVMPDGESFEGRIDYVSIKPEISHTMSKILRDGSVEIMSLPRDASIRICRLADAPVVQQAAPILHALQTATVASPSLTSLANVVVEVDKEEAEAKRVKTASPSNQPK